jgi:hypothetical protein
MSVAGGFRTEEQLVKVGRRLIRRALRGIGASADVRYEVPAPGGIPDLVLFSGSRERIQYVVTIEFKLSDWRRGLLQSFRSRNFGNETYLVLDSRHVGAALKHYNLFKQANVGLLSISPDSGLQVWHYPDPQLPFSTKFSKALARSLVGSRRTVPKDLSFTRSTRGGWFLSELRELLGAPLVRNVGLDSI